MSDPDVPQSEQPKDVDDVVGSANAGLDAAAARQVSRHPRCLCARRRPHASVDPDLAAFEAAERDHPGTFRLRRLPPRPRASPRMPTTTASRVDARRRPRGDHAVLVPRRGVDGRRTPRTRIPYADDETRIVPSEPAVAAAATPLVPQPIFVQAPEPPRDRGNRGTAGAIGLLATVVFAMLYLGTTLGLGALAGDVTGENIGDAAVAPLTTWGFWTPVVVFFLGFWLLGAIINRGRWGLWVVFGIIVGVIAYGGHILGAAVRGAVLAAQPPREGNELVGEQLLRTRSRSRPSCSPAS